MQVSCSRDLKFIQATLDMWSVAQMASSNFNECWLLKYLWYLFDCFQHPYGEDIEIYEAQDLIDYLQDILPEVSEQVIHVENIMVLCTSIMYVTCKMMSGLFHCFLTLLAHKYSLVAESDASFISSSALKSPVSLSSFMLSIFLMLSVNFSHFHLIWRESSLFILGTLPFSERRR